MAPTANGQLPNVHLRKQWKKNVKTWFNQPGQKKSRRLTRAKKQLKAAPRPLEKLRPVVRCPTVRYNRKVRLGRGFSLEELKSAKLTPQYAQTIGIAIDWRRKNKSEEGLKKNSERLQSYLAKLVVYPLKKQGKIDTTPAVKGNVLPVKQDTKAIVAGKITEDMKKVDAYKTLRAAWVDKRLKGIREKQAKLKAEEEANQKQSKKK
jgi:large subunit ribosomal protein L13e